MARRKVKNGEKSRSLLFFAPYFPARLDFPSPPISAPGSPRMVFFVIFDHVALLRESEKMTCILAVLLALR